MPAADKTVEMVRLKLKILLVFPWKGARDRGLTPQHAVALFRLLKLRREQAVGETILLTVFKASQRRAKG
jgi:hypothetical protein